MLQAEPVSNSDELPLDYLQGHKDGSSGLHNWQKPIIRKQVTGCTTTKSNLRAIRKGPDMPTVQGGNSPVIPDGWVMVPVELTRICVQHGIRLRTQTMMTTTCRLHTAR